jgi:hypothetical protein
VKSLANCLGKTIELNGPIDESAAEEGHINMLWKRRTGPFVVIYHLVTTTYAASPLL